MQQHERLKLARQKAGYRTATEAANALGTSIPTYTAHENGSRGLTVRTAELYSRRFKVRTSWLLTGEEPMYYSDSPEYKPLPEATEETWGKYIPGERYRGIAENSVAEIDAFASEGSISDSYEAVGTWSFPSDFLTNVLGIRHEDIFLVALPDNSMMPLLRLGDRAIADSSVRKYRGDGPYVIRDVDGNLYVRLLTKLLYNREGGDMSIATLNPGEAYFVHAHNIDIAGKVIGKVGAI